MRLKLMEIVRGGAGGLISACKQLLDCTLYPSRSVACKLHVCILLAGMGIAAGG